MHRLQVEPAVPAVRENLICFGGTVIRGISALIAYGQQWERFSIYIGTHLIDVIEDDMLVRAFS